MRDESCNSQTYISTIPHRIRRYYRIFIRFAEVLTSSATYSTGSGHANPRTVSATPKFRPANKCTTTTSEDEQGFHNCALTSQFHTGQPKPSDRHGQHRSQSRQVNCTINKRLRKLHADDCMP
ncbi:hypothetical protein BV898_10560 [Hypsibius exemplaris]|uniref:Uncharacterized protein n=1 Tax=Hypsibius exemplaris TaxID=2072580 RepID=A0A1W0WJE6_HYPEX|nr:hypothetical protein BV898_10560 [Hypsibius exemplaris]